MVAKPLSQLAHVYSGGTPSRSVASFWGGAIPWVSTGEIGDGPINNTKESITEDGLRSSAARIAPAGTLLMAMYGQGKTRGKTAILGIDAAMNQACAAIEPGPELDSRYLLAFLQARYDEIRAMSNAGSQDNLSGQIVKQIEVVYPPRAEQERIAEVLKDADEYIANVERMIAKKQAMKQGLMQHLLTGRTRIPGFEGKWRVMTVGSMGTIVGGGTPSRSVAAFWGGPIPWATVKDISNFDPSATQEFVTRDAVMGSATRIIPAGTPILAARMLVGKAVRFDVDVAINQDLKAIMLGPDFDPSFLCHWFDLNGRSLAAAAGGSTVAGISTGHIRAVSLHVPTDRAEQEAVARTLSDADNEIRALKARLAKARDIKTGMMQQLLTGRVRLGVGATE